MWLILNGTVDKHKPGHKRRWFSSFDFFARKTWFLNLVVEVFGDFCLLVFCFCLFLGFFIVVYFLLILERRCAVEGSVCLLFSLALTLFF